MADNSTIGSVLVAGGGIAGIQAALDLADSGYYVHLVEQTPSIGGAMSQLDKTFPTNDCSMCIMSPKLVEVGRHVNIELHTLSQISEISGKAGNFEITLEKSPRFINPAKCTGCGECAEACPVSLPSAFEQGLGHRQAIYKPYAQAVPGAFAITKKDRSPCTNACPNSVNAHAYVALAKEKKYRQAMEVILRNLPLPGSIGRICPHPCEEACRRELVESPVSICALKRFIADQVDMRDLDAPEITPRDERVAIVGAGPAGLTAAAFLARAGVGVTIFEALPAAGGMLKVGIPDYRLPPRILEEEISYITGRLGVEIHYNTALGRDFTLDSLKEDRFKSVYLAIGCHRGMALGIPGEGFKGVIPGVKLLKEVALGGFDTLSGHVVIIGGGDVAIDAARTALRIGAETVSILYRRTRAEMPARNEEIEDALEEGVGMQFLTAPGEVVARDDRTVGIQCVRMELGTPDKSGRRRPVPVENSAFLIPCDYIIPAIGQKTDTAWMEGDRGITINRWGNIEADPVTYETAMAGVFAGGDAHTGPSIAINAVAAGNEAGISILRFLDGKDLAADRKPLEYVQKNFNEIPDRIKKAERQTMARLPGARRLAGFGEVELGLTEEQALTEAKRCLDCMVCCECFECVKACGAGALTLGTHLERTETATLKAGSVIFSPGFKTFDPSGLENYRYADHPNVMTALEFERILSASGPTKGHLVRLSDHREPKKIAWFQCVGSRETNQCDNRYCSSVCCMYALKEAVIAREHAGDDLECTVFYMDMRTHGKDFERSLNTARAQGVRLLRTRVHSVEPVRKTGDLLVRYVTNAGELKTEIFDMIVLSVGLEISPEVVDLAGRVGIELTQGNFASTPSFAPVKTSRKGIFVCGAFQGPKDIPQSVVDSSAAAAEAGALLSGARNTLTRHPEAVPETDVRGERPRIGVFVCKCGSNINGVVNVPEVSDYAATLPHVEYASHNLYTCSQDTQDAMTRIIQEHRLNRIVVAACTPKTHEPLFQETLINAGLNKYLFEMTNIRNHDSWVHRDNPGMATQKAKELVAMSVAKVALAEPLTESELTINPVAMVVGGGVSGLSAARNFAEQGYEVHVVEKEDRLGGQANHLYHTYKGEEIREELSVLTRRISENKKVHVHLGTTLDQVEGFVGNFKSTLTGNGENRTIEHGVAVLATGATGLKPAEYHYGEDERILTSLELDRWLLDGDPAVKKINAAVFIQCVGSREPHRPYCSRVCCTHSIDNALALKKQNPDMAVYILYRDIRTYGEREYNYLQAREEGVIFIRYSVENKPEVRVTEAHLLVTVEDHILNRPLRIEADLLTLATAIVPNRDEVLANFFKVPLNEDGFFVERHAKLGPSEFATDGVFLCGLAHYPKPVDEAIAHGQAAAARAVTLLAREKIHTSGHVADVDTALCSGCGGCISICPYSAPGFIAEGRFQGKAGINPVLCKGCGLCAASCRSGAIRLNGFDFNQLFAQISALADAV
ncbi:MAG: FAD-dependent oxidoreductase [Desulfobacterium sp.]|nr:FAD-dependent oxidoreductase [Desulfobacterium sp.]